MNALLERLRAFLRSEDGPTATEYAVLLALIAGGVLSVMANFGTHVNDMYVTIAQAVGQM